MDVTTSEELLPDQIITVGGVNINDSYDVSHALKEIGEIVRSDWLNDLTPLSKEEELAISKYWP